MSLDDIMSKNVICCNSNDSIVTVSKIMKENDIGFVPVSNKNKIIGVITDRDIVVKIASNGDFSGNLCDYMSKEIVSVSVDCSIYDVLNAMKDNKVKRVLVCDDKRFVGVISISDLLKYDVDNLFDTIKNIWSISSSEHNNDTDVSDFYL